MENGHTSPAASSAVLAATSKMESWKKDGMLCPGQGAVRAGCSLQHTWVASVQLYKVVNSLPFPSRKLLASICVGVSVISYT